MSHTDPHYLRTEQYRDSANLSARAGLHERFSTNPHGWHRWVFDHLQLPPQSRVLELGGGPGFLWRENAERVPSGWGVTLSDFSPGMAAEARQHLAGRHPGFTFAVLDAQALPFPEASFDAVIANHMLYHVPDRPRAFAEIRRVLKPGGRLLAATNGQAHMRELRELIGASPDRWTDAFSLENGREQLAPWFARVTIHRYEDALVVTEAEPLLAYALSTAHGPDLVGEKRAALARRIEQEIAAQGAFRITKETGLFEAW